MIFPGSVRRLSEGWPGPEMASPERGSLRLEQCGHYVAEIVKSDLPQADSVDQPLERADQIARLDRSASSCCEHEVVGSPRGADAGAGSGFQHNLSKLVSLVVRRKSMT